jgi:hypothetical protein
MLPETRVEIYCLKREMVKLWVTVVSGGNGDSDGSGDGSGQWWQW